MHILSIVSCKRFEDPIIDQVEKTSPVKQELTAVLKPYFPLPYAAYSYTFETRICPLPVNQNHTFFMPFSSSHRPSSQSP